MREVSRPRTQHNVPGQGSTARSGDECTNHEATAPPGTNIMVHMKIAKFPKEVHPEKFYVTSALASKMENILSIPMLTPTQGTSRKQK